MNKHLIPEEELEKLLAKSMLPDSIRTCIRDSDELFLQNKILSAQEKLSTALDFIPGNLHLLNAYGNLLLIIGKPEYAALEFVKITVIDKNFAVANLSADALLLVAENYLQVDDPDTASMLFKRVIEIEPDNETAKKKLLLIQS